MAASASSEAAADRAARARAPPCRVLAGARCRPLCSHGTLWHQGHDGSCPDCPRVLAGDPAQAPPQAEGAGGPQQSRQDFAAFLQEVPEAAQDSVAPHCCRWLLSAQFAGLSWPVDLVHCLHFQHSRLCWESRNVKCNLRLCRLRESLQSKEATPKKRGGAEDRSRDETPWELPSVQVQLVEGCFVESSLLGIVLVWTRI